MHPVVEALMNELSRFSEVRQVILFGSRARGDERPRSDIDLAVVGVQSDQAWTQIRQVAEEARTLLSIDLLRFEQADAAIKDSILREGKILYERTTDTTSDS